MEVNLNLNGPERADLRQYLINRFSLVELKIIAADLGLDYDNFPHQTKEEFAPAFIAYFEREKRLRELISLATEQRSDEKITGLLSRPEPAPGQPPPYPRREQDTALRQSYLRGLIDRIGRLSLAQINPEQSGGILLEEVYVDSPTPLALSLKVNNWQIVDWWLTRLDQPKSRQATGAEGEGMRYKPEELGYTRPPFEALVSELQSEIEEYRKKKPQAQPDDYSYKNKWNNGVKERRLHLKELAAVCERLVILGAPGSGKSTFVRYLALALAEVELKGGSHPAKLENWLAGSLTPVYIELRRFVASAHFPPNLKVLATADHLKAYIRQELQAEGLEAYAEGLNYELEHGQALLILDGLDEVPYPEGQLKQRQAQLIGLAQSLHNRYPGSRTLVASRPYAYAGWRLPGFESVTISPFEDEHRLALACRLYRAVNLSEAEAQAKAKGLNQQLKAIDPELKDRPLFVTLMATLYLKSGEKGLPTGRGALYRESILLLLERWTQSKPGVPSLLEILRDKSPDELYARLAALAYEVHDTYGERPGTPEVGRSLLYKHFHRMGRGIPDELIPYLSENAGVLVSPGQNEQEEVYHFAHRTFQEYLAAVHLVSLCQKTDAFDQICRHILEKPQVWRVPGALTGDILADSGRKRDLWQLLESLLEDAPSDGVAADPRWWLVWLAATIAQEQELYAQENLKGTKKLVKQRLVDGLVALLQTAQALPPPERAACGRLLALLGDPRPGLDTRQYLVSGREIALPQIEWCNITAPPGGKFWRGADNQEANPRRKVKLGYNFKMSKYPITYAQFQSFIASGEYPDPTWWQGFPEEYQPQLPNKQAFKYTNHPCEEVSWYQAVAFSRWLTASYRAAGLPEIELGLELRLPTEREWEYAARGSDERKYPYLGEFDATKANTAETGIRMTSAVGSFPDGASPFGVLDMSGNVQEWCWNKYSNSDAKRVLRGGSFSYNSLNAACAYRSYSYPFDNDNLSFRVVVSSPIAPSDL